MAKTVTIDQLADEITNAIKGYTEDVSKAITKKVDDVSKEVLAEVEKTAPKHTGEYAETFTITKNDADSRVRRIIWNKKHYGRVHLLEFGHAKIGGGRVKAFPHMRPAYEKYGADLPEDIKKIVKNGG
ncbi:MAG TPA: HK97 gp10 family phage protein [Negativicutes bacterium]|nr:HK97 gp10 family phage protein [Negativicutes bacterium]